MNEKKPKVVVNITKKRSTTIDKHGKILEEKDNGSFDEIKKARAKKLGFE